MLVKLGDVWVDPARVAFIRKTKSSFSAPPMTGESTIQVVEVLLHEGHVYPIATTEEVPQDSYAAIVNEALSPKQTWSEEEPENETP